MHLVAALGVSVTPYLASGDSVPVTYGFLPGSDLLVPASRAASHDLFVALDAPDPARLGDALPIAQAADALIVIDHHPDNKEYGSINLVDERAASTGSMIWELAKHAGWEVSPQVAECLFTALMTDTGRFSYGNTTAEALRCAAELVEHGVEPARVYRRVYENRSPGALALIARTMSRLEFAAGGRLAFSWISAEDFLETGALPEETENLIDEIRSVRGVDAVALLKASHDSVRVSLRAKDGMDVGSIARALGGGGHTAAAGFTRAGSVESVLAELLLLFPPAS